MKKMARWTWLLIIRDWKTRILAVGFFLFLGTFSLLYRQQNLVFPVIEMDYEYTDAQQIFRLIPDSHFEGEFGEEVQHTLGNNALLLGVNRYILGQQEGNEIIGMESIPDYITNGRQIAENNLFLHQAEEFESHDLLVDIYLPSLEEVEQQLRFFDAMVERDMDIEWNPYSSAEVLREQVELISGVLMFVFIALIAADHFTRDQTNNWSVTQGLPISWKRQWRLRSTYLWAIMWSSALLGIFVSYIVSLFFETTGNLSYPMGLYINGAIHYISLWQYILLLIGLSMLLSYILMLFATGLSWMIRNIYLTMLIVVMLFFLPHIWQFISPFTAWQPSMYLNPLAIVQGKSAADFELSGLEFWRMPLIVIGLWLSLEVAFSKVFQFIPTQTLGLKRRESK